MGRLVPEFGIEVANYHLFLFFDGIACCFPYISNVRSIGGDDILTRRALLLAFVFVVAA